MFEGERNPSYMREVEYSILKKIKEKRFDKIIHLSTVYCNIYNNNYTDIKKEIEYEILKNKNSLILRLSNIIGENLNKGIVYDILNNNKLFVNNASFFNIITLEEIWNIIDYFMKNFYCGIINVGASESICVKDIAKLLNKKPIYGNEEKKIFVDVNMIKSFYPIKTSFQYIEDYIIKYI